MNPASTNFTSFKPLILLRHNESNSLDSKFAVIQSFGGFKYLSQFLQKSNVPCFGMFSVISTCVLRHAAHVFSGFGSIRVPHEQHKLKTINIDENPE
jgi:hypothetical protein